MSDFRESALIFGKAVLSVEPLTGAAIKVIEDFRAAAREKATEEILEAFRARLAELEGRLDGDFVATEDFADLFKSCVLLADRTHRGEKLRAAANALANGLLRVGDPEKVAFRELDHFVRCLERLSIGSLELLAALADACPINGSYLGRSLSDSLEIESFAVRFPQIDPNLIDACLNELHLAGLCHVDRPEYRPSISELVRDSESETGRSVYEVPGSEPPSARVTPLGWRFRNYVLTDAAVRADAGSPKDAAS